MLIKFQPKFYQAEVEHLLSGDLWRYGEIKNIPDDRRIRVRMNRQAYYVRLTDDLLSNPDFILADTGANPNYTCCKCGIESREEGIASTYFSKLKPFEDAEGNRLCATCFDTFQNPTP